MYAIIIVDDELSRVVMAVDPMGIKPLHISAAGGTTWAASTLAALPHELRRTAWRVPAGEVRTSDGEIARISLPAPRHRSLHEALDAAVADQIPAEVAWGCALSGGLDSAVITALAARHHPGVVTISVGLTGSDDLAAAARVAAALGTEHHEVLVGEAQLPGLIDEAVRATSSADASTVMGGVGALVAAREAKRLGLKVLLFGEGADELFAGYDEYKLTPEPLLSDELLFDQQELAATECKRLDLCTMAESIEARVPYLSARVVAFARALPLRELLDPAWPQPPREKLALRRVADGLLPADIAWRPKTGFSTGSGLMAAGARLARQRLSDAGQAYVAGLPGWKAFARSQRLIGADERLAAFTFSRWQELCAADLGRWDELPGRGLARPFLSDGPYRPGSAGRPARKGPSPARGVLVLASSLHTQHPYAEWLRDLQAPLLAIAPAAAPPASDFAHVSLVDAWSEDLIIEHALTLERTYGIDRVIGLGEVDILTAARIRDLLDLPGQRLPSARAYRDKLTMRQQAAAGGVAVPAFAPADSAGDVLRFLAQHGGPVMVKPRLGGGSVGIHRVDDAAGAASLRLPDVKGGHLVESYVPGATFHVDAVRAGGEMVLAVPCAYIGDGCLAHWSDAAGGSWTLSPANPLHDRLTQAAAGVLAALPGPADLTVHAEFFVNDDGIVLCEVAARGGGIPIPAMLVRRIGADMRELWARVQTGLPVDWEAVRRHVAKAPLVANVGVPPRNGRIRALPDGAPPGVQDLVFDCAPGEDFSGTRYEARRSGSFVGTWVVTADDERALLRAIGDSIGRVEQAIVWDLALPGETVGRLEGTGADNGSRAAAWHVMPCRAPGARPALIQPGSC
jgi:hypothetical protein